MATKPVFALPVGGGPSASTGGLNTEINRVVDEVWKAAVVAGLDTPEAAALAGQVQAAANTATQEAASAAAERMTTQMVRAQVEGLRDEAENLVSNAVTMGGWYETIALGRAAVADGETFGVRPNGSDGLLRPTVYQRTSASTQDLVVDPPRGAEVDALAARQKVTGYPGAPPRLIMRDGAGNAGLISTPNEFRSGPLRVTDTEIAHPAIESLRARQAVEGDAYLGAPPRLIIRDGARNAGLISSPREFRSGPVHVTEEAILHPMIDAMNEKIERGSGLSYAALDARTDAFGRAPCAALAAIIVTGQSLSTYSGHAGIALTTTPLPYAKMFTGGPNWPWMDLELNTGAYIAAVHDSIVPFVEGSSAHSTGETPSGGIARMMQQLALADGWSFGEPSGQYLFLTGPGIAGAPVASLMSEPMFDYPLADIDALASLSTDAGQSAMVFAMPIIQGESDTNGNAATWKANWQIYKANIEAHLEAVYGQPCNIFTPIYQMARSQSTSSRNVMLAQLELSQLDDWGLACPIYWLEKVADATHLTAISTLWMGAHFGRCIYERVYKGFTRRPLVPVAQRRFGNSVALQFPVVDGNALTWDTTQVPLATNRGFELVAANKSTALTVTGVEIVGRDTVVITSDAPIPAGAFVRYAFNGNGTTGFENLRAWGFGNLRDNDRLVFDPAGVALPMHNWAPIFEQEVSHE